MVEIKREDSQTDLRFRRLFKSLIKMPEFVCLGNVLKYLIEHKYDADSTELKKFLE